MLAPQLCDDADEQFDFLLEPIDWVEISARRYSLFSHPGRFLYTWGSGEEMVPRNFALLNSQLPTPKEQPFPTLNPQLPTTLNIELGVGN